jgi:hypothetical protein
VADRGVVEGAVRLHVGDAGPGHPGDAVQGGELVEDVVGQLGRIDVDEPAAEPGQVAVGHLRADGDSPGGGPGAHAAHRRRVPGVEAAGDVRAGDDVEQGVVVPQSPYAEALTEVGVEIHRPLTGGGHRRSVAGSTSRHGDMSTMRARM